MATISSTQAGVWSAGSTWAGGVKPAAGDTVNITHTVTYDENTTTLYGDINVNAGGSLVHDTATTKICLGAGNILTITGGRYEMVPNSTLLLQSASRTTGSVGRLRLNTATAGGKLICNGTPPMFRETLAVSGVVGDTYVTLSNSASGRLAAGDYVSIYYPREGLSSWSYDASPWFDDEGFIVHRVDTVDPTKVHLRRRVAVRDTTTTTLTVSGVAQVGVNNPRRWTSGTKVQLGLNTLTVGSVSGSTVLFTETAIDDATTSGNWMYETGLETAHASGQMFELLCTTTSASAAIAATTIYVNNTYDFSTNDVVVLEETTKGDRGMATPEYTVLSKTSSSITFTAGLTYAIPSGATVVKVNRDCKIGSYDPTDVNKVFAIWVGDGTTLSGVQCILRYTEIERGAHDDSISYMAPSLRGDFRASNCTCEMTGCSLRKGWSYAYSSICIYILYGAIIRNNVITNCNAGITHYACQSTLVANNVILGANYAIYFPSVPNQNNFVNYNLLVNSDFALYTYSRRGNSPFYSNEVKGCLYPTAFVVSSADEAGTINRLKITNCTYRQPYAVGSGTVILSMVDDIDSAYTSNIAVAGATSLLETSYGSSRANFVGYNFDPTDFRIYAGAGLLEKDTSIVQGGSFSLRSTSTTTTYSVAYLDPIYLVKGNTYNIKMYFRKNSAYNGGTRPCIILVNHLKPPSTDSIVRYEMPNVNDTWVPVEATITPAETGIYSLGFGGIHSAGYFWVDPRCSISVPNRDIANVAQTKQPIFTFQETPSTTPLIRI